MGLLAPGYEEVKADDIGTAEDLAGHTVNAPENFVNEFKAGFNNSFIANTMRTLKNTGEQYLSQSPRLDQNTINKINKVYPDLDLPHGTRRNVAVSAIGDRINNMWYDTMRQQANPDAITRLSGFAGNILGTTADPAGTALGGIAAKSGAAFLTPVATKAINRIGVTNLMGKQAGRFGTMIENATAGGTGFAGFQAVQEVPKQLNRVGIGQDTKWAESAYNIANAFGVGAGLATFGTGLGFLSDFMSKKTVDILKRNRRPITEEMEANAKEAAMGQALSGMDTDVEPYIKQGAHDAANRTKRDLRENNENLAEIYQKLTDAHRSVIRKLQDNPTDREALAQHHELTYLRHHLGDEAEGVSSSRFDPNQLLMESTPKGQDFRIKDRKDAVLRTEQTPDTMRLVQSKVSEDAANEGHDKALLKQAIKEARRKNQNFETSKNINRSLLRAAEQLEQEGFKFDKPEKFNRRGERLIPKEDRPFLKLREAPENFDSTIREDIPDGAQAGRPAVDFNDVRQFINQLQQKGDIPPVFEIPDPLPNVDDEVLSTDEHLNTFDEASIEEMKNRIGEANQSFRKEIEATQRAIDKQPDFETMADDMTVRLIKRDQGGFKQAFEDWRGTFSRKRIRSLWDELKQVRDHAFENSENPVSSVMGRAGQIKRSREFELKNNFLSQLRDLSAQNDMIDFAEEVQRQGFVNPFIRAVIGRLSGLPQKIFNSRNSTELQATQHAQRTINEFNNDIARNDLHHLVNSKDHEFEIADHIEALKQGRLHEMPDSKFKTLAQILDKFWTRFEKGMRKYGIVYDSPSDRIAPQVHNKKEILKLTRQERQHIGKDRSNQAEFLFKRWRDFVEPRLDKDRTLRKHNVDPTDPEAVDDFLRNVFITITDNELKMQKPRLNLKDKMKKSRVIHFKSTREFVEYNNKFGTEFLMDAITREFGRNARNLSIMNHWGVSPQANLERVFQAFDEMKGGFRIDKKDEINRANRLMNDLLGSKNDAPSRFAELTNNLRAWQNMTKLGFAGIKSIPDLALVANELSRLDENPFGAMVGAIKNVFTNNRQENQLIAEMLGIAKEQNMGGYAKFHSPDTNASKLLERGSRLEFKLNGLESWDYGLRSYVAGCNARWFAVNRNKTFSQLGAQNQRILLSYGIDAPHWDAIRQGPSTLIGNRQYIAPDSVQNVDRSIIENVLKHEGRKVTDQSIQDMRDEIENNLRGYFQDRQDHVILRPDLVDRDIMGGFQDNGSGLQKVMQLMTQFKSYGLAMLRKPVFEKLFGDGAQDFNEALLQGRGDRLGLAKLAAYTMAMNYAALTATNLAQGRSPPPVNQASTWLQLIEPAAGILGDVFDIDPNDPLRSTAQYIAGPTANDAFKLWKGAAKAGEGLVNTDRLKGSEKAFVSFAQGNMPLVNQFYSRWAMNQLLFNELQDKIDPKSRKREQRRLEREFGTTQLF